MNPDKIVRLKLMADHGLEVKPRRWQVFKRKSHRNKLKYIRAYMQCHRRIEWRPEGEDTAILRFYMAGYKHLLVTEDSMRGHFIAPAVYLALLFMWGLLAFYLLGVRGLGK